MLTSYYRGADGVILVYDITNEDSFFDLQRWINDVEKYAKPTVTLTLLGNKSDLDNKRSVDFKQGKLVADNRSMKFLETSAKDGTNVEKAFIDMANELMEKSIIATKTTCLKQSPIQVGGSNTISSSYSGFHCC